LRGRRPARQQRPPDRARSADRGGHRPMTDPLSVGRRVLLAEAEALTGMANGLGEDFVRAVEMLARADGRVVLTGIGKSGHVARTAPSQTRSPSAAVSGWRTPRR